MWCKVNKNSKLFCTFVEKFDETAHARQVKTNFLALALLQPCTNN